MGARTIRGPTSAYLEGSRSCHTLGGSTTWSSTEMIIGRGSGMAIQRSPPPTGRRVGRLEALIKETHQGLPGPAVGGLVIGDAGKGVRRGQLVGERVHGPAVDIHLPIDAARPHLLLEGPPLFRVHHGVVGADESQHLAGDVAGVL